MSSLLSGIINEARNAAGGMKDFATGLVSPTLRIGVTGLSRSGKTVFITALVHALLHGGKLPLFTALTRGRINRVYLEPQPDYDVPRFDYETHVEALTGDDRHWPQSTSRLSQLRLTIEYEATGVVARNLQGSKLHVDIIDYPGEWLLDLPLMSQSYAEWSAATLAASEREPRKSLAKDWLAHLATLDPTAPADEAAVQKAAKLFTAYLASCRAAGKAIPDGLDHEPTSGRDRPGVASARVPGDSRYRGCENLPCPVAVPDASQIPQTLRVPSLVRRLCTMR